LVIIVVIVINVLGQLLMKLGMNELKPVDFHDRLISEFIRIFSNKYVIFGVITYIIGTFLWLYVLSKMELSISYPMLSLSYVFIALVSWLLLHEPMTLNKIIGIVIISLGVFILNR
jgi:drug/metabolite transporter (DMT)-like permease